MKKRKIAIASMALTAMCVTTLALVGCSTHTHTLESIAKEDATCTAAGHEAYYKCTDPECGKLFSDSEGKTEISAIPTIAAKGHDMTKHGNVPATCTTDGTAEYYTCKNEAETVYYDPAELFASSVGCAIPFHAFDHFDIGRFVLRESGDE